MAVLIALSTLLLGAISCSKKSSTGKPSDVDYYTCTMHPSVKSHDPKAKCPICSMDLVPVMKKGTAASPPATDHAQHARHMEHMPGMQMEGATTNAADASRTDTPTEFTIPVERQQQIGVTYGTVEKRPFKH